MFGTPPKIGLTFSLLSANMITKLKTKEELQVALESIQVLSNANENNVVIIEKQNEDGEEQIIEKQTKTRQTSISQKKKESLHNLKIQAKKLTEMPKKRFRQGNIWESVKTPDEDRALNDLRCILGVSMSSDNYNKLHIISLLTF